jgi:glutaredoxin
LNTVMWTKDQCDFCVKAKAMLVSKGIKFEERNLSGNAWNKEQLLEAAPTAQTVPQIWLYGKYVGGHDDLCRYFDDHNMWSGDSQL